MRNSSSPVAATSAMADDHSPITDVEALPVILRIDEIARIYRRGVETIRRELRQGIFRPLPFDTHPYRWRRVDILDDIARRPAESVRRRRHKKAS